VTADTTVLQVIKAIDAGTYKIALVVDAQGKLLGSVTDGDVRRAILRSIGLDHPVSQIMNQTPTTAHCSTPREVVLATLQERSLHHMPLLDDEGRVAELVVLDELIAPRLHDNIAVLMAGGRGSRLQPLTNDCPKPMLRVGGVPLLETILLKLIEAGFRKFYISVNYMAEIIESHFGTGSTWNVDIQYIREAQPMGTAGSLSLLPAIPDKPFLVMNADLLTTINFDELLDFHIRQRSRATMAVREYNFEVPFGVVKMNDLSIIDIEEKPVHHFFINAGVYVLEPQVLSYIPTGSYFDMPMLFDAIKERNEQITAFPLREYCLDIGRPEDFARANTEFERFFL
jgi:dTDP-glucose pyrophosphorylase